MNKQTSFSIGSEKQCEQVYYTVFQKVRSVVEQQNKEEVYGNAGWGGKL